MIVISNFLFNFINFCVILVILAKLLTLDILFSTAVRAVVVAKLVISGILPSMFLSLHYIHPF